MPTQIFRDHNLAVHFVRHLSFSVPALTIPYRYRLQLHIIFCSAITQNVGFGRTLRDTCRPRAGREDGAHALAEFLCGEIVDNGGEGG